MPSTPRPRGFAGGASGSVRSATNTPMSERQQMALLMQMTSSSNNQSGMQIFWNNIIFLLTKNSKLIVFVL